MDVQRPSELTRLALVGLGSGRLGIRTHVVCCLDESKDMWQSV